MTTRTLISFEKLPPRTAVLDRIKVDTDIRATMDVLTARLNDRAQQYVVGGFVAAEPEFEHAGDHTLVGKLLLERPD